MLITKKVVQWVLLQFCDGELIITTEFYTDHMKTEWSIFDRQTLKISKVYLMCVILALRQKLSWGQMCGASSVDSKLPETYGTVSVTQGMCQQKYQL